ncbi:protein IQ-DOMAIN 31-like isoform X2 [Rhododendron vialii]|uniref:protein IQ-DOMAIN 31-like isoform X2 n=1 Tax=Rhododendron vialii TaxID=182163 RepID=UPI00265F664F|nr:protein IQ-DOMAIN 31-like isoform X2 [Rhododendron vialii]
MGKSPGKWIKTVLFGKKSSKSSFSKNAAIEEKVAPSDPYVISDLPPQTTYRSDENTELEFLPGNQGADTEGIVVSNSANNAEIIRQEQAATKAQAAVRGYLARRAFQALKGIIRLQALIRGHLVRRQAVATWRCMQAVIKLQALARGRKVRLSEVGIEVLKKRRLGESMQEREQVDIIAVNALSMSEKQPTNAFLRKLVASLPTAMPLSLQYDRVEPNSVWNWLELWSSSHSWEPLAQPKKSLNTKHKKRQTNKKSTERESGRPKRGVQRVPALNSDSNLLNSSSEYVKPKRNLKKAPTHQTELVREHSQNEVERVKHKTRKVSVSAEDVSDHKTEAVTEKQELDNSSEKTSDLTVVVSAQPVVVEPAPKELEVDETVEMSQIDLPAVEVLSSESGDKVMISDKIIEELSSKEDQIMEKPIANGDKIIEELSSKEDQITEKPMAGRRKSFSAKQEYPENVSQNTPTLPSYMQVTESAKAKLRAQGSPKFGEDGAETGFDRRHSLPSPMNGKLSSLSPRVQKPVQANGKGGSRIDRSLLSSRDEKVLQPGWKR